MTPIHKSIMVPEILSMFDLKPNAVVADLTTGEGGHSSFMAPLIPQGKLLCLDRDEEILNIAKKRLEEHPHITYVCDTYDHISAVREQAGFPLFDAILVDMGVSMFHFKEAKRGFSFEDLSLDMRLDDSSESAKDIINTYSEAELADIFYYYGEEFSSRKLARIIVQQRPFDTAKELAGCILKSAGNRGKTHPATKIFQALRIYVNKELEIAETFLEEVVSNLASGGKLCILTFHSMEDRLVKNAFRRFADKNKGVLPITKPMPPSLAEQKANPASRSAKLRVFQRS
ncbi:MAG: 16S rRNA (cytosine(1402)-N(4))-methyltransferase RsmH [Brevinema sp.]